MRLQPVRLRQGYGGPAEASREGGPSGSERVCRETGPNGPIAHRDAPSLDEARSRIEMMMSEAPRASDFAKASSGPRRSPKGVGGNEE